MYNKLYCFSMLSFICYILCKLNYNFDNIIILYDRLLRNYNKATQLFPKQNLFKYITSKYIKIYFGFYSFYREKHGIMTPQGNIHLKHYDITK